MRLFFSFVFCIFSLLSHAESTLPEGCAAIKVQGRALTLKLKDAKLIFIHNITNADLWITHPVTDAHASAGWSSRLQAEHWSALAVEKSPFTLTCIESRPGHEQEIPCKDAIAVCQWADATIPKKDKGTFWAAEDLSLAGLTAAVGARGFVLPVAK